MANKESVDSIFRVIVVLSSFFFQLYLIYEIIF